MSRLLAAAFLSVAAAAIPASAAPIIGGTPAAEGDFPSVVAVELLGGQALCTGTLVHREWVITAAHCLDPAQLGLRDQQAVTNTVRVLFYSVDTASGGTKIGAQETLFDPAFDPNDLGHNDIGLIHLKVPITDIAPTPINFDGSKSPVGTTVTMVGFGTRQIGAKGPFGTEYVLQNRTSKPCGSFNGLGGPPLEDANLLCFSQEDGKGKCEGDSGGPSFAMIDGVQTLVGVTSFGDNDCEYVGADTRPEADTDIIQAHVPKACDHDSDCDDGHSCFDHGCIVEPFSPSGLGATCADGTECESGDCEAGPDGTMECATSCTPSTDGNCPDGFDCAANDTGGECFPDPSSGGGCCDAGPHGVPTMLIGVALCGLALRRRRPYTRA